MFLKVPEPKTTKNRVHVDLAVADPAAEVARIVGLGADRQVVLRRDVMAPRRAT